MHIAIDVGGTFTDFAWQSDGVIHTGKVLTTSPDPSVGVLAGLEELVRSRFDHVPWIIHATTLASNTAIEHTGATTAVVTTRGFRDVLLIGRQKRYDVYDVSIQRPKPLVPRRRILEIDERMGADAQIRRTPTTDDIPSIVKELTAQHVSAIAVCLLNSYANDANERRLVAAIRSAAPHLFVSASADVSPQWREYERFSTTVLNAYLGPTLAHYLTSLEDGLTKRGFRGRLLLMQSSGGVAPADVMARYPVRLLESGPAAGVLMAAKLSTQLGLRDLISFDMGGTTAKLGLIRDGTVNVTDTFEIGQVDLKPRSGLPVMVPGVDLIEIGAGGGSIARPVRGLIQVGPRSAGAAPGPACYGRGGTEPTVTDSDLLLGYLDPAYFAGGSIRLSAESAGTAMVGELAEPLDMSVPDAAWAVHRVVNINMATAAKAASISRGIDVREHALLAFGGAGPVHAARVAEELGISRVIIPPSAGVGSAVGLLRADARFDVVRTLRLRVGSDAAPAVSEVYEHLRTAAHALLRGLSSSNRRLYRRSADLRYVGQGFEVRTVVPDGPLDADAMAALAETFHETYERIYGRAARDQAIEAIHWRLAVIEPIELPTARHAKGDPGAEMARGTRLAFFPESGGFTQCPVFRRYQLPAGFVSNGPAIVEENDSTTVVPPRWTVTVDDQANLVLNWVR